MHNVIEQQPEGMQRRYALLLFLFFLLAYILPLGARSLFVPDEVRYAEIPREMIATGDWVVPHLDGVRYFEKPVLGYWVHAGSLLLFGENNFAVRLPSALAVGLSAWLILRCSSAGWAVRKARKTGCSPCWPLSSICRARKCMWWATSPCSTACSPFF